MRAGAAGVTQSSACLVGIRSLTTRGSGERMRSFRFIHAADIHLDSPLKGLAGLEGSAVEAIQLATRSALEALVSQTIEEEAAFLIIAGDLYDGNWRDYQTGLFFVGQMGLLRKAGIPVFLVQGNHDAQSVITRRLSLPENVTMFSHKQPETVPIQELGVALHGQSFAQRDVSKNLARGYPEPVPDALNIGILHTGLGGEEGHQNYAPCTLTELTSKGYDYWALGHVHHASVRHERPYVVYSGNIQGRHIKETGPKGAVLVTVEDGEIADLDPFHIDVVRWAMVEVSATGCETRQDISERIRDAIEGAVAEKSDGRLLACRIHITGRTRIQDQILGHQEWLLAESRAAAQGLGEERAWVERVVIATDPDSTAGADPVLEDALGDLADALEDHSLRDEVKRDIGGLVSTLPPEVRDQAEDPLLRAAVERDYARIIELAGPYARARLAGGED